MIKRSLFKPRGFSSLEENMNDFSFENTANGVGLRRCLKIDDVSLGDTNLCLYFGLRIKKRINPMSADENIQLDFLSAAKETPKNRPFLLRHTGVEFALLGNFEVFK